MKVDVSFITVMMMKIWLTGVTRFEEKMGRKKARFYKGTSYIPFRISHLRYFLI